jgi:hypothetical protein
VLGNEGAHAKRRDTMNDDLEQQKEEQAEENKEAEEEVKALEEDPPKDLKDWPDGKAKYKTFGGPEGNESYEEGPTANLGSSDVRHHEDGSVTVGGEKVDDPDEYKGDPIPGGPTDPNAAGITGEKNIKDEERGPQEEEDDDDD